MLEVSTFVLLSLFIFIIFVTFSRPSPYLYYFTSFPCLFGSITLACTVRREDIPNCRHDFHPSYEKIQCVVCQGMCPVQWMDCCQFAASLQHLSLGLVFHQATNESDSCLELRTSETMQELGRDCMGDIERQIQRSKLGKLPLVDILSPHRTHA